MTVAVGSDASEVAVRHYLRARVRMPLCLVGPPGVGKSAFTTSVTEEIGYELLTLIGSAMEPTDVSGLPKGAPIYTKVHEDGTEEVLEGTVYLMPYWQVRILQKKKVVLFFDEWSNTSPAVRASFLNLLQKYEFINGEKVPEETIIMMAMNPADQAADGELLDLPTSNRIVFIPWNPSVQAWYAGMLKAWGKKASLREMQWRAKIVKFIQGNTKLLQKERNDSPSPAAHGANPKDATDMEIYHLAWPSRRSWDNLAKLLAAADPEDAFEQDMLARGTVGYEAAAAFRNWLNVSSQVDPDELLENPYLVDWTKIAMNDAHVLLRALLDKIDEHNLPKVAAVYNGVITAGRANYVGPYMRELLQRGTAREFPAATIEHNQKILAVLAKKLKNLSKRED